MQKKLESWTNELFANDIEVRSLEIGVEIFILCCSLLDLYGIRTLSKDRFNVLMNMPY